MSATGAAATIARHHQRKTPKSPSLRGPQVTSTGRRGDACTASPPFPPRVCARQQQGPLRGASRAGALPPLIAPAGAATAGAPTAIRYLQDSRIPSVAAAAHRRHPWRSPHRGRTVWQTHPLGGDNQERKKKRRRHHRRRQRHGWAEQKGSHYPTPLAQHLGVAEGKSPLAMSPRPCHPPRAGRTGRRRR